mmetsp:Transcript_74525/g.216141  ORF Transcript_74525/g.216141 Transcript_74525/m.216141 type:complete len:292 (+) Transcript_74525:2319-3194(+)
MSPASRRRCLRRTGRRRRVALPMEIGRRLCTRRRTAFPVAAAALPMSPAAPRTTRRQGGSLPRCGWPSTCRLFRTTWKPWSWRCAPRPGPQSAGPSSGAVWAAASSASTTSTSTTLLTMPRSRGIPAVLSAPAAADPAVWNGVTKLTPSPTRVARGTSCPTPSATAPTTKAGTTALRCLGSARSPPRAAAAMASLPRSQSRSMLLPRTAQRRQMFPVLAAPVRAEALPLPTPLRRPRSHRRPAKARAPAMLREPSFGATTRSRHSMLTAMLGARNHDLEVGVPLCQMRLPR